MSERPTVTCAAFGEAAPALAVGTVAEPYRSELFTHAASCASCAAALADLSEVADGLLNLAPEVEPPVGFETRAVARMGHPPDASTGAATWRQWHRSVAIAASVVVSLAAGVVLGRTTADRPDAAAPAASGVIVSVTGQRVGTVDLEARATPRVVLTMDRSGSWPGVWTCQIRAADGRWVDVGSYTAEDVIGRVWAAGIDLALLGSSEMRILDGSGTVVATATLDG